MLLIAKKIHCIGKIVVLGGYLCDLQGLLGIKNEGGYWSTIVKKSWYWKCYIHVKNIKAHFTEEFFRAMDSLPGEIDNVPLFVFAMK